LRVRGSDRWHPDEIGPRLDEVQVRELEAGWNAKVGPN
jgi:hypothetical protein